MSTSELAREAWLSPLLSFARSGGELHPYGSPEWCALADGSWRKIAAACQVGECWQQWWDDLPVRLEEAWVTQWVTAGHVTPGRVGYG